MQLDSGCAGPVCVAKVACGARLGVLGNGGAQPCAHPLESFDVFSLYYTVENLH